MRCFKSVMFNSKSSELISVRRRGNCAPGTPEDMKKTPSVLTIDEFYNMPTMGWRSSSTKAEQLQARARTNSGSRP